MKEEMTGSNESAEGEDLSSYSDDELSVRLQNFNRAAASARRMRSDFGEELASLSNKSFEETALELMRRGREDIIMSTP